MSTRKALATLIAFIGLVGLVLVNVGGASGLHDPAQPSDNVLRLHLDADGDYFKHGSAQQDLVESQCLVDDPSQAGPLVSLSASNDRLGLAFDSLGVRSQGPGRSCGRVDGSESFEVSINNASGDVLSGLKFESMELDIEAKQDAWVEATAYLAGAEVGSFQMRTGSSIVAGVGTDAAPATPWLATSTSLAPIANCLNPSDSGPDSGANDNCRWVVQSSVPFDTVKFESLNGEFGLEGGEDGTLAATAGENSDSLFYLTDVGVLDCGDTIETGDSLGDPFVSVTRLAQLNCQLKEFLLGSAANPPDLGSGVQSFSFVPFGGGVGQAGATYELTVTWVKEPAINPLPVTQMDYNGDGDTNDPFEGDLVWCDGTAANPVLPSTGEPWCRTNQTVTLVGTGYVQLTEELFGSEDPHGLR